MRNLVDETPEASAWVKQAVTNHSNDRFFGKTVSAVLWADDPDGDPVGGDEPSELIAEINAHGLPMFKGHDPGFPVGRTVAAQLFTSPAGVKFVAAILSLYEDDKRLRFSELDIDPLPPASSPAVINGLSDDCWLDFATDPREIDKQWVNEVPTGCPHKSQTDRTLSQCRRAPRRADTHWSGLCGARLESAAF